MLRGWVDRVFRCMRGCVRVYERVCHLEPVSTRMSGRCQSFRPAVSRPVERGGGGERRVGGGLREDMYEEGCMKVKLYVKGVSGYI